MSRNEIPFQALARNPMPTYQDIQEQRLRNENLQRAGRIQEGQLAEAEQAQRDQMNIRKVLSAGLPDDQAIQQLRMLGLHEFAQQYEKSIFDRREAMAKASKAELEQHDAKLKQTAQVLQGLRVVREGDPRRASAWFKYRNTHTDAADMPDVISNADIDMILAQIKPVLSDLDQARLAHEQGEEQRAAEEALKPSALGGVYTTGGVQKQRIIQPRAYGGGYDIVTQELGPTDVKPDTNVTETELAVRAAKGDKDALRAISLLHQQQPGEFE